MKKLNIYFGAFAIAVSSLALSSCNNDLELPPYENPAESGLGVGDGTWESPLQVWQANLGTTVDAHLSNWVTGYIIGYINNDPLPNTFSSAVIANGVDKASKNNNVILAQYPYDEVKWEELGYTLEDCIAVQLPSGASRSAVNLSDHPENFNRQVSLRGVTGSKYMGQYGLRSAYEYNWGDKGRYELPMENPAAGQYFCDFSTSHDINYYLERGWSLYMQKGGLTGWYVSEYDNINFLTCSSYYGDKVGGPYINWVVSPRLDLDALETKTLSFRSQARTPNDYTKLRVFLMRHQNPTYYGDQIPEPIELDCVISSSNNVWTSSGDIDLSEYSGEVYIGFMYEAQEGGDGACTFNITDFNFGNCNPEDWEVVDPATIGNYKPASELKSGNSYLLVFKGNMVATALAESLNYGRMSCVNIEPEDGVITTKKENAVTFTQDSEGKGWQLVDGYGRTLYIQAGYETSFQLAQNGAMPASGALWNITKEGDLYKISNIDFKAVIYRTSFGNCAPGTDGDLPQLYELVED